MLQKEKFNIKHVIVFISCLISIVMVFYVTTLDQIIRPRTDVVGGSSMFETNTLRYIIYFVSFLITMIILGLILGKSKPRKSAKLKPFNQLNRNTNEIIREIKNELTPQLLILILLATLGISRYVSYLSFLIIENRFLKLSNLMIFPDWTVAIILFLSLVSTIIAAKRLFTVNKFASLAVAMPIGAISLLYLTMSNTLSKFKNSSELSSFSWLIIALLLGNCIYVIQVTRRKIKIENVLYVGILAGLHFLLSRIPGSINKLDYFEDYPILNVHGFSNWGYQPWSELQLNHGLYHDFIRPLVGTWFVDNSAWGMQAGIQAILFPLEVMMVLYCIGSIFRNKLFTLYIFLFSYAIVNVVPGEGVNSWIFIYSLPRAIPLLFCTLALRRVVEKKSPADHALFALAISVSTLWASENLIIWIVCGFTALYFTIIDNKNRFKDLVNLAMSSLVIPVAAIYSILGLLGLSTAFLNDYEGLSSNIFQGALAFNFKSGVPYTLSALGLPVLFGYFGLKYGRQLRKGIQRSELILIPSLTVGVYYYVKFLAWPDLHIQQATNALNVIWIFLMLQIWSWISKEKNLVSIVKISGIAIIASTLVLNLAPSRQQTPKIDSPEVEFLGPVAPSFELEITRYKNLKSFIQKQTGVEDPVVLDFTNSPVFVHLLPNLKFVPDLEFTSFYVSHSQQLRALSNIVGNPPDAIILSGPVGLSNGVFPGEMFQRNYVISKYIFENYQQINSYDNFSILTRGLPNLNISNMGDLLSKTSLTCNWFKALNSVPKLSEIDLITGSAETLNLEEIAFMGVNLRDLVGFKVSVSSPGVYSISVNTGMGRVVPVTTFESTFQRKKELFVPVDSCPAWGLNSSPLQRIEILGEGLKLLGIVVATG